MSDIRYPIGKLEKFAATVGRDRRECFGLMARAPALLGEAVQHLSSKQLDTPYREGGWSVRQIVHHFANSQLNWYVRTKLTLTEDEPTIRPFDGDRWSDLEDAQRASVEPSLVLLTGLYERWVPLLQSLTPQEWSRRLYHPERGWMVLADTLPMHAWHGQHHTAQITALSRRMNWM
jgi:uncharacterized damage-inducible protein DinB